MSNCRRFSDGSKPRRKWQRNRWRKNGCAGRGECANSGSRAPVEPSRRVRLAMWTLRAAAQAEAADAERAGNWETAVTRYAEQHEALKQYQRELRKTEHAGTESRDCATDQRSRFIASSLRAREVLRRERIANAPTKGLPRERASTPKAAEVNADRRNSLFDCQPGRRRSPAADARG